MRFVCRPTSIVVALTLSIGLAGASLAAGVVVVPPGNSEKLQPDVHPGAKQRTRETGGSFEGKYKRALAMLARDKALIADIKRTASLYGIDPVHILGAIVAEHTYNVDSTDSAQAYVIKAAEYLGTSITFAYGGETVTDFVGRPEFEVCKAGGSDYDLWTCREGVWKKTFRGKTVDGVGYPNDRFAKVFFQPLYAGQTFGLGQLSPLTALMVSDMVASRSGLPRLSPDEAPKVYHAIMDPEISLHYTAAVIRMSIDAYRAAGFDISKNPGLTATLYNVGDVKARAAGLARKGRKGHPEVNYFGWFVNEKQADLEALL